MEFTTIKKNTAVNMVVEQILKQIRNQGLPPGSKLPAQRELAVMLGVGRSSIREAINNLVARGYLEPIQGKGTFIKEAMQSPERQFEKLSIAARKSSLFDLMEARTVLECKTASLAATRADTEDIQKLKEIFGTLAGATDHDSYDVFLKADQAFHFALAEATSNKIICEMTKFVLQLLTEHHGKLKADLLSHTYREKSVDSLGEVLKAILAHNPAAAASWMGKHLTVIYEELDNVL
jgi:GntR family transcriptional repressor for pyruvate dehydrogenase complex